MLLTIALIVAAIIAVAAFELSCFWRLGERDDRRRLRIRAEVDAEERRADSRSRGEREHHTTGALGRRRGRSTHRRSAGWIHKYHRDCDRNAQCDQDQQQVLDTSETSPPGLIR